MTDLYQIIYIYISVVKVYLSKPQLSSLLLLLTLDIAYSSVRIAERSSDISAERNRPGRFFFWHVPNQMLVGFQGFPFGQSRGTGKHDLQSLKCMNLLNCWCVNFTPHSSRPKL